MPFGVKPGEAVRGAWDAVRNEALAKIPGYSSGASIYRTVQARKAKQQTKTAANTVDEHEFYSAKNKIEAEIGGSLNPFKWLWSIFQSLIGNSRNERIVAVIRDFENYGHQHDAYQFQHRAQEFLLTELERRIAKIESMGSKYLGTHNNKVNEDTVLAALKSAIKTWLEPFNRISHGEVQEIARLTESDIKFLMNIRDRIRYSSKSRYLEDILPDYEQAIQAAQQSQQSTRAATNPAGGQRRVGEQLAKHQAA